MSAKYIDMIQNAFAAEKSIQAVVYDDRVGRTETITLKKGMDIRWTPEEKRIVPNTSPIARSVRDCDLHIIDHTTKNKLRIIELT